MHARPSNTGPRTTLTCLTFMPVAALSAEADVDAFALVVGVVPRAPLPPGVDAGTVGETRVGPAALDPMKPPDADEGDESLEVEFDELAFLSTILKLAQAMRVLLA